MTEVGANSLSSISHPTIPSVKQAGNHCLNCYSKGSNVEHIAHYFLNKVVHYITQLHPGESNLTPPLASQGGVNNSSNGK